ncbi:N-acetylglucosamine kinase [Flavobacteriaceae bacterium]|jgi:N-acetylglucosamine kinase-like BadF-type ATPase|nr:N-acetylglucosamine kinase [Flavobacteriaceae bacterium]MDB2342580.1 N-acetylglucosamine kinase [Flavobacteriaceae bacterium]MDC0874479.1 N-acetylglucosamine kinase [Flavobacteriaceae bacterium]MDC1030802.1 N-acetylglucosamine kinase [Flavobacteriaceae bacterium]
MILVVDSGSTKTDWIAVDISGDTLFATQTLGLNPQVLSSAILKERIINNFDLYQNREQVTHLYFYGAGCGVDSPQQRIKKVFDEIFVHAEIIIKEDTYAAVYATVQPEEEAIVCILGTGSNCTYYDGSNIEQRVTSLGYILMDEASGNFFGKQLIRSYYFNTMPKQLALEFEKEYDLSPDAVKENIYRRENPNTYLATFSRFLIKHKDIPLFQDIIAKGLKRFINHQILQFDNAKEVPIHFIGSISHFLKDEIETALKRKGLTMGRIVQRPIDELVKYHKVLLDAKV